MGLCEVNVDGLVGPTHNYAGLSYGNVASVRHAGSVARPRDAALEGLSKMRALADRGLPQMVLPPQERPCVPALRSMGFDGPDAEVLARAAREAPRLLASACSASSMWAANAATVTPSTDAADGRVHLTPANLVGTLHRALEPPQTRRALERLFPGPRFVVHGPLPASTPLGDEGAANHTRLTGADGRGVHLFVYGRVGLEGGSAQARYPARHTLEASRAVARRHGLDPARALFVHQSPEAVDQGVFHNDVIAVGHEQLLLFHEQAWVETDEVIERLRELTGEALVPVRVTARELSVDEAVGSYLFNSQIVTTAAGAGLLVAPSECEEAPRARAVLDRLVADADIPIDDVLFLDVRQSMQNGGGPACLRLRVPLTDDELRSVHPACRFDPALHARLEAWIRRHFRETLAPGDLPDPHLLDESRAALDELTRILDLGTDFYPFQRSP
ncbi:MAG: N-succinylarginine dihydrolase [Myxococcota bacterium]